jgi:hypothetical protein
LWRCTFSKSQTRKEGSKEKLRGTGEFSVRFPSIPTQARKEREEKWIPRRMRGEIYAKERGYERVLFQHWGIGRERENFRKRKRFSGREFLRNGGFPVQERRWIGGAN